VSATEPTHDEASAALIWLSGFATPEPVGFDANVAEMVKRRVRILSAFIEQHADPRPPAAHVSRETLVLRDEKWESPFEDEEPKIEPTELEQREQGCTCESDEDGLFVRACVQCGTIRGTGHCYHDGIQRPCPVCNYMPETAHTPLQALGFP